MMHQSFETSKEKHCISIGFFLGWSLTFLLAFARPSHLLYNQLILRKPVALQKLSLAICQNPCVGDGMAEPPTRFVVHRTCPGWVKSHANTMFFWIKKMTPILEVNFLGIFFGQFNFKCQFKCHDLHVLVAYLKR